VIGKAEGPLSRPHGPAIGSGLDWRAIIAAVSSRYDDDIWELVPEDPGEPPAHLVRFVQSLEPARRALDLGCGDGRLSALVEADELTAADVSGVALDRARRRLPGAVLVELEPDAPLPFGDSSFDLVLCAETIEHVRDLQFLLSEARRVLEPGGTLAVTTPAHSRFTALRVAAAGFERRFPPLSPHLRFLTRRSLYDLLRDLGFSVRRISRRHGTLLARAGR
jgi:SAM-dependent methyltransferase